MESLEQKHNNLGWLSNNSLSIIRKDSDKVGVPQWKFQQHLTSGSDPRREYKLARYGYGKDGIKLLYVRRNEESKRHEIREYEIDVALNLNNQNDYLIGDNKHIIATDSQKNTIYVLAKRYGIESPEEFGMVVTNHFLDKYPQVNEANVRIEEYPWARHAVEGVPHNHAFTMTPTAGRYCQVYQKRNELPQIQGGLKDLRVLKTTQSAFKEFVSDEYRTLPDSNDRIFSTIVTASWTFKDLPLGSNNKVDFDFDRVWNTVRRCILEQFAGDPHNGIYSPSVQHTLYLAEACVLRRENQIESIEMKMPNKHYFAFDFEKFKNLNLNENSLKIHEVYTPIDKPSGVIYAQLKRNDLDKDIKSKL